MMQMTQTWAYKVDSKLFCSRVCIDRMVPLADHTRVHISETVARGVDCFGCGGPLTPEPAA